MTHQCRIPRELIASPGHLQNPLASVCQSTRPKIPSAVCLGSHTLSAPTGRKKVARGKRAARHPGQPSKNIQPPLPIGWGEGLNSRIVKTNPKANDQSAPQTAARAGFALGSIGTNALPPLLTIVRDTEDTRRGSAIVGINVVDVRSAAASFAERLQRPHAGRPRPSHQHSLPQVPRGFHTQTHSTPLSP